MLYRASERCSLPVSPDTGWPPPSRPTLDPKPSEENITTMIQEGEQGKIVEVKHEVARKTVEVWVE
jgi:hypothetical protein